MALAEDTRPEENWLVGLRPYALQRPRDVSLSTVAEYWLVADSISDAMPNRQIVNVRGSIVKSY
jgi:hypothetical protein